MEKRQYGAQAAAAADDDILKSPFSRVYVRPETEQVINCAMGFNHPIDVEALKLDLSRSLLVRHPRFSSLLVQGRTWRRTQVKIDEHIIVHHNINLPHQRQDGVEPTTTTEAAAVNSYLGELAVSSPLSRDKPLWEVHVFAGAGSGLNFIILRVHHAVGDGVSLMSMLAACFGPRGGGEGKEEVAVVGRRKKPVRRWRERGSVWEVVKSVGLTVGFVIKAAGKSLWVRDDFAKTGLRGGGGDRVEVRPRVEVTAEFELEDMRSVKKHIPNATANDVLLGVISCGLSRYLKAHSPKDNLPDVDGVHITGVLMVNMRKVPGLIKENQLMGSRSSKGGYWGNKVGVFIVPISCNPSVHPLHHVRRAKAMMDNKKQSFEAQVVHKYNSLTTYICGPKVLTTAYTRVARNTTFMLSNIMGPKEEISIAGNPVTYIKLSTSSLPTAITMHMVSYMGKAYLQVMVPKDIVHDPPFLAKCFVDSLLEMKNSSK